MPVVKASGLSHKGDDTHFDSPLARELGRRYAAIFQNFKKILRGQKPQRAAIYSAFF